MFCEYNETLLQNGQCETSTDQSCPLLDTPESHKLMSVSRPEPTSDVVVVCNDEDTTGLLSDQVNHINQNTLHPHPPSRLDCGIQSSPHSGYEPSLDSSRNFKIQGMGRPLSRETQVCETGSFFEQNGSDTDCGKYYNSCSIPSDFRLLQDRSRRHEEIGKKASLPSRNQVSVTDLSFYENSTDVIPKVYDDNICQNGMPFGAEASCFSPRYTEAQEREESLFTVTQDHDTNPFFEQNRRDKSHRKYSTDCGIQSNFEFFHIQSQSAEDSERQRFLFTGTQVHEQKNPGINFLEHLTDDRLGLGVAVESSQDRFIYAQSNESETSLLHLNDEDRPSRPKRLRTSVLGIARPGGKKSSPACHQYDDPVRSEKVRTSVSAETQPTATISSLPGAGGVPVEKSLCTEELVLPLSRVYSTRSVSLMQLEEGMHVITAETVAHTVFADLSPESEMLNSRNTPAQNLAIGCYDTKDERNGNNATILSSDSSTKFATDASNHVQVDDRVQEIILSPCQTSTAVINRVPSKTSTSYLSGKTDRADIAGGWKPVCGQTVVRKLPKPSQNSISSTSDRVRKQPQPVQDSLWTTFDGAAKKSGILRQSVSGQERFLPAEKDQEPLLAPSASVSGVHGKSGNVMKSQGPAYSQGTFADMPITSSVGEGLGLARVQSLTRSSNGDCQSTFRKPVTSVKNFVEVPSSNSSEPVKRFEPETVEGSQLLQTGSIGQWIELATVQNMQKRKTSGSGDTSYCGAGDFPPRNSSRLDAVGFPSYQPGSATESSFDSRFDSIRVHNMEKKRTDDGKKGKEHTVSKWDKFQEVADVPRHQQPPVHSSSLVRTTDHSPFQHTQTPSTSNLVRTQSAATQPVITHTATSSLMQSPFHSDVQQSSASKKPEVACVTPQVRQPLRALHLGHNAAANTPAGDGVYLCHF